MFNPELLNGFFGQVNPESKLQNIVANAFKTFTTNMSGSSGGISGFISGVF